MERKRSLWSDPRVLPLVHAFASVVAAGSFTKASRRTGVDKSLLSRRVQALEAALEVQLLVRTTRKLRVTDEGTALYASVSTQLDEVAAALGEASAGDKLRGRLVVATSPPLARQVVVPVVRRMRADHPHVLVDVRATESFVSLVDEGIDIALRMGRLKDSSLIARKLATARYVLVASKRWAADHPHVTSPEQLDGHWLLYTKVARADQWRFERGDQVLDVRVTPCVLVDEGHVLLESVRAGLGVGALFAMQVSEALRSGELVRVAPSWRVTHSIGIYAVYPNRTLMPRRAQTFLDMLDDQLDEMELMWRAQTD